MDFVYAINVNNKPCFSMPNGMPMVSVIFHAKENLESKPMLWNKMFAQRLVMNNMWIFFNLNEFLSENQKNIFFATKSNFQNKIIIQ